MLERQGLALEAWTAIGQLPVTHEATCRLAERMAVRPIVDAATRQFLGFASAARLAPAPSLFARKALEVYETEDASLVCTVYRPWLFSWTWDIFDAEEHHICIFYRGLLFDSAANRLATIERSHSNQPGKFVSPRGAELARVELRDDEWQLYFNPAIERQPFLRMALLGGLLALADRPAAMPRAVTARSA